MSAKVANSTVEIAVVICTHNRYDCLPDALASVVEQSLPRSKYEIIVIDNSSDRQAQQAFWQRSRHKYPATVKFQEKPSLSTARNAAVHVATAPIVAYADDDAVASPNWLESLVGVFKEEHSAGVAGGPVDTIWPGPTPAWLHPWLSGFYSLVNHGSSRRALQASEWVVGTNMAFRRDLLLRVGGFDENLGRRGAQLLSNEELEIFGRIRELGFAVFYEPSALVYRRVPEDRASQGWLRRRVAWQALSDALVPAPLTDPQRNWEVLANYFLRSPPEMRSIRGLFLDVTDGETLHRQCEAIGALMKLMLFNADDPENFASS